MGIPKPVRLRLAAFTAMVMLADNITTILAISSGARELNPLVSAFLQNPLLYTLFTVFKVLLGFTLTYMYVKNRSSLILWSLSMLAFLQAIMTNIANYFSLQYRKLMYLH